MCICNGTELLGERIITSAPECLLGNPYSRYRTNTTMHFVKTNSTVMTLNCNFLSQYRFHSVLLRISDKSIYTRISSYRQDFSPFCV